MIFIYVPSDCIQHEFLIHFFFFFFAETTEVFIFLDISEMPFCLDGTDLTVSDSLFTLDIRMALLLQFLPVFVDLHDLVLIPVTFFILVSQMNAKSLSHSSTIRSTALTPCMFA